jgi:hypothetical protein
MTAEIAPSQVIDPARRAKAEDRAGRIVGHLESAAADIAAAIIEEDWTALGLSREEWRARLLYGDRRLTPAARKTVHELLSGSGMGTKEIAGATGTPQRTVQDDLSRKSCATTADQPSSDESVTRKARPKTPAQRMREHRERKSAGRVEPVVTAITKTPAQDPAQAPATPEEENRRLRAQLKLKDAECKAVRAELAEFRRFHKMSENGTGPLAELRRVRRERDETVHRLEGDLKVARADIAYWRQRAGAADDASAWADAG